MSPFSRRARAEAQDALNAETVARAHAAIDRRLDLVRAEAAVRASFRTGSRGERGTRS